MVLLVVGCSPNKTPETPANPEKEYPVILNYANNEYINTGNESLPKLLQVKTNIKGTADTIYLNTILALQTTPQGDQYGTLVRKEITVKKVRLDKGIAYVDLAKENLNGSSLQESFFIDQIVNTLMDSFKEVKGVQFLVEGQTVESLMGHIDTTKPLSK